MSRLVCDWSSTIVRNAKSTATWLYPMYVYESVVSLLLSMMCQVERTVSINDDHLMVEEDSKSICVMVEKQRAAAATASTTAALKAVLVAGGMPREEKEKSLCPWVFFVAIYPSEECPPRRTSGSCLVPSTGLSFPRVGFALVVSFVLPLPLVLLFYRPVFFWTCEAWRLAVGFFNLGLSGSSRSGKGKERELRRYGCGGGGRVFG